MDRPGTQMSTWMLCVVLSWLCVAQAAPGPHYMVAIPAVLEAGARTQFCASLLKPNESMVVTVTLRSKAGNMTIIEEQSSQDFHSCFVFQVPPGDNDIAHFDVEVRGATFYSKEVRKVMIRTYKPMTFVQTDKPIYLPGQTVNFRVVTIDTKFRPSAGLYDAIHIADPNRNKIGQWLNQTSDGKILQLSYTLSSEAREGPYHVFVSRGKDEVYQYFKVEKYVLPRFEVKLDSPDEVSIGQDEIKFKVCAKYTYGQSVPCTITANKCRPLHLYLTRNNEGITAPCYVEKQKADKSGCATFAFEMSNFKKVDESMVQDSLLLTTRVEEEGTGITQDKETTISISYITGKLAFVDTPRIYEQGSDLVGKVKAVHHNDTPVSNMSVYLFEGDRWSPRKVQQLTTDSEGFATFRYNSTGSNGDINLYVSDAPEFRASYAIHRSGYYESGHHAVSMAQDASPDIKTASSLEVQSKSQPFPCGTEEQISVKYTIVGEKPGSADVVYLVLARGAIVMQGSDFIEVGSQAVTEGEITLKITVSPEMAPMIQFVVYAVLPSEVVVANTADFSVEKCFSHKVSLKFSPSSSVPGETNTLQVKAQPASLCGVSAFDQSVHIKEPGKGLNADRIFDLLPVTKSTHIPYEVLDQEECLVVRPKRYILPEGMDDTYTILKDVGLKMVTNLDIRVPKCLQYGGRKYIYSWHDYPIAVAMHHDFGSGGSLVKTVRTFFPETWIWDLVETGDSGVAEIPLKVPDTITTWETEAFCLSSEGLGLAPKEKLTVFQPFFLELSLPYSIIRGENLELKATVFNYQNSCYMVSVSPEPSSDYTLSPIPGEESKACLCSNDRKTFRWTLTPSVLGDVKVSVKAEALDSYITCNNEIVNTPERGRIDIVTKTLKVKAEGIEMKKATTWLLCPKDKVLTEKIEVQLPDNVIEGSARAVVSVLGDIMGRAMNNLDGLLQMPHGCGEQNIALLAPNIYTLTYLQDTNQLTPAIQEKGTGHLTSGYQRQLNYKHYNGAFSTFGSGQGNTWLTAFVIRSLVKAQNFIFIDQEIIAESKTWLESRQQHNGCFEQLGKLFNNAMKGGVSDDVTITAYVTAAFLEMNRTITDSVARSLSCLNKTVDDFNNTYATALQAYVFTLAGETEIRTRLLRHLDSVAIKDGGFIHWSQSATDHLSSISVEMTAYVLLAILHGSPSTEELGNANGIVRWLTSKQNYYGGFSSTQDTVVALQALALYSTMVFSRDGFSKVFIKSPSGQLEFDITQDNKLLYQEKVLSDVSGEYKVEVTGMVCASVQISHHYNIPTPITITNLDVKVNSFTECDRSLHRPTMTLTFDTVYKGSQEVSNMVILDIKLLSGFVPHPESLGWLELRQSSRVERVDYEEDHVLVYIKEMAKGIQVQYTMKLIQELPVSDLKKAVVKLYDYYQPSDVAQADYVYPCAAA